MDLLQALATVYQILGFSAVLLVITVAMVFGGPPHRACALIALFDALALYVLMSALDLKQVEWMVQVRSVLVLLAYSGVVVRWRDRWLVMLMGLQGFAVILHLSTMLDDDILMPTTSLLLNVTGWSMLIILTSATVAWALQRNDAKRAYRRP